VALAAGRTHRGRRSRRQDQGHVFSRAVPSPASSPWKEQGWCGHSLLVIVWHLLQHACPYVDLGSTYFDDRDRVATERRLVHRRSRTGNAVKAVASSGGQTILRRFLSGETFAVGAGRSQLQNLAVLQVVQAPYFVPRVPTGRSPN
jgi:hypothetical protein